MSLAVGTDLFLTQLAAVGFSPSFQGDYVVIDFVIPLGTLLGQQIKVGLFAPADFPFTPPPGPHVSPRLGHPDQAVHDSPLGPDWEYWSRPFQHWASTDRTVRTYMAHIRQLFALR